MNILKGSIIVIVAILGLEVQTALYRFIPEYPELYVDCTDQPGTFGIDHFIDQSEWIAFYDDEGVHVEGTVKIIWDIKNTDRMTMNAELQKKFRGGWQRTPFSVRILDFCKEMSDSRSYVYETWTRYIIPEDLQCLGKGVKYRQNPFTVKVEDQALTNMKGRYKVVLFFRAYDEHNRLRPEVICVEVPGEVIKV
uniref:Uncharacterized protein n=1 Tax=Glossina morsitans morsitans TaxID=37546 RepID=A0A1B0GFR3_GLOMM